MERSPRSLIVSCSTHPSGANEAFGMSKRASFNRGNVYPLVISFLMIFSNAAWCFTADLWFPLAAWNSKSNFLSLEEIGLKGNEMPFMRISFKADQFGC